MSLTLFNKTVSRQDQAIRDCREMVVSRTSAWSTPVINQAHMVDAPMLETRLDEIRHWLKSHPELLFSLVVGLAQGQGEDRAWGMAYG